MQDRLYVLVVDDDRDLRETLCENLAESGFNVASACDGEDALRLIEEGHNPDVVVADIVMPRKDGFETIRDIRRRRPCAAIIAISGGGRPGSMDFLALARKQGADAVLEKPVDPRKLGALILQVAT